MIDTTPSQRGPLVATPSSRKLLGADRQVIPLSIFPPEVQELLNVFDADGSGTIDPSELAVAARRARDDQKTLTRFRWLAVVGVVLFVILSAMQFGVSLAAVSLAKESHVSGTTMTTLNGDVVRTANSDFVVGTDGVATARNASGPIAVAVHAQSTGTLSTQIPDEVWASMAHITLTSVTNATMTITVFGFVRTADRSVELITPLGTIVINGTVVTFANTAALSSAFQDNGFITTTGRLLHAQGGPRRLDTTTVTASGTYTCGVGSCAYTSCSGGYYLSPLNSGLVAGASTACFSANETSAITITCPSGSTISTFPGFSSYGKVTGVCGAQVASSSCSNVNTTDAVNSKCGGQVTCSLSPLNGWWANSYGNPCTGGGTNQFVAQVTCKTPVQGSCTACPPGYFAAAGSLYCSPCDLGTYLVDATKGTVDAACAACPAGSYAPLLGTTACTQCPGGSYSSSTGLTDASQCMICQQNALHMWSPRGSTTSDACQICPPGTAAVYDLPATLTTASYFLVITLNNPGFMNLAEVQGACSGWGVGWGK